MVHGKIPKYWRNYPNKSDELLVGSFLIFKTPLCCEYDAGLPPEMRFRPKMIFEFCKSEGMQLNLWMDVTSSEKFYNPHEVTRRGCTYFKLRCRGRATPPSRHQTKVFVRVVHDFIMRRPTEKIGVHCTDGYNKSGFLIVAYLVEKMGIGLDTAIEMFASVRPPGIQRGSYLQELAKRYGD